MYIDGACSNNGVKDAHAAKPRAGFGIYYGDQDPRNVALPLPPAVGTEEPTNNRAELYALIYLLHQHIISFQQQQRDWLVALKEQLEMCPECRGDYTGNSSETAEAVWEACWAALSSPNWPSHEHRISIASSTALVGQSCEWDQKLWWLREALEKRKMRREDSLDLPPPPSLPQLVVYTDSRYVIDGMVSYAKTWVTRSFRLKSSNKIVLNLDYWKYGLALRDYYNTLYAAQRDRSAAVPKHFTVFNTHNLKESEGVVLFHVKGHSTSKGNIGADLLAVMGAKAE